MCHPSVIHVESEFAVDVLDPDSSVVRNHAEQAGADVADLVVVVQQVNVPLDDLRGRARVSVEGPRSAQRQYCA